MTRDGFCDDDARWCLCLAKARAKAEQGSPLTCRTPRDGHNALVVKVVNASGVPACISACHSAYAKIVHIDLQMPAEAS